ncbi:bifunctional lysylphosphatidylglycerol flippase/synthetase MprF [Tissierella sp.]|uniref:bifunctional lysylphosphatidylglycerol flippase/synthetase MprF n=1 Tax=Tissierella sp. TaxID=41274 RepID=UPI0028AE73DD|nr:bifunctional lysylphosphatidylglycerol flippase/synthetase MprF [Tissierella sp.]
MERFKLLLKKNGTKLLKLVFIIFIVGIIITSGVEELKSIDYAKTIAIIREFPINRILIFTILGMIAVSSMSLYDFAIVKYLNLNIKSITIFSITFVANTINNISGLGGLTGASIRTMLFKNSTDTKEKIIDYNLLLIPATGIGLSFMMIIALFKYQYIAPIIEKYKLIIVAIVIFIIYFIVYFFIDEIFYGLNKGLIHRRDHGRMILKVKLLLFSFIDWIVAFSLFFTIVRQFNKTVNLDIIFIIFTLGSIAGILSLLPSGVGSFDLVVLLGFQYYGMITEDVLAILILYRIFYYVIPLIIGIVFTLIVQSKSENKLIQFIKISRIKDFINKASVITNLLLSILILSSGVILLLSALIPGIIDRIKIASRLLSFPILQLSRQLSICVGILLIAISREIRMKVKRSYRITMWLLFFGAIFTLIKGFDYEETIFLVIVLIILKMSKESFYRKSLPIDWFKSFLTMILAFIGILAYMKMGHKILRDFIKVEYFKTLILRGTSWNVLGGIVAYGLLIIFVIYYELTKDRITKDSRHEDVDEEKLYKFLHEYEGNFSTHFIFLKDKHLFWSKNNKVLIQYEISHNLAIVLGDPIGDQQYFDEALIEFQDFIDEYGYKSIFYQSSEKLLPFYHNHGYYFFKLGETGLVELDNFDINSPKSRDFRNTLRRFEKDGFIFEFYNEGAMDEKLFLSIKEVSDEWLDDREEMGFSLGWFNKEYLNKSKIGIVMNKETKEIIAFASISPSYDNNSASIDLMRFKKNVPSNTMTFLILNLLLKFKEDNYKLFNLGMAPLSNVGITQNAHIQERMAHLVFKYGKHFYSFDGLRKYKNKFDPRWEGRYLVYEDLTLLPSSLIEVTWLIHSKKKKS